VDIRVRDEDLDALGLEAALEPDGAKLEGVLLETGLGVALAFRDLPVGDALAIDQRAVDPRRASAIRLSSAPLGWPG
jgi:hypothetical protein